MKKTDSKFKLWYFSWSPDPFRKGSSKNNAINYLLIVDKTYFFKLLLNKVLYTREGKVNRK